MIFITGGSCQGKVAFAKEQFPDRILMPAYQFSVEKYVKEGKDPVEQTEAMLQMNPEVVIIMSEMGCGMTPGKAEDRILREQVGRVGCYLADMAYRVTAGIGERIK